MRRLAPILMSLAALTAVDARAEDKVEVKAEYFTEPAAKEALHVFHPTVGVAVDALAIDSYAASWTQVLTPILVSDLGVTFQVLDGFQSNPYRRVRLFGTVEAQESEPLLRQRVAVQARVRLALVRARGALG